MYYYHIYVAKINYSWCISIEKQTITY